MVQHPGTCPRAAGGASALRVFRYYLLVGSLRAPRPAGCWSDLDPRMDKQVITWLKTNRHLNKMYVRWLDEIEDFRFDVTHLPGSRNPADPCQSTMEYPTPQSGPDS